MTSRPHPYRTFPDYQFWSRSIANREYYTVDPVISPKFTIKTTDKVVTAGSCFAQHIARRLSNSGFSYYVTEQPNSMIPAHLATKFGYGVFSARYGNIYTTRQLLQLLWRAYGQFEPIEDIWIGEGNYLIDPFRPQIQPSGFASLAEYRACLRDHFSAVRQAVENLDVFVFTLGLTEAWTSKADGSVYPICPGVSGGVFDPGKYQFVNFRVSDVTDDLRAAIAFIRSRNAVAKFILTVSPVPLVATAEDRSVLVSTTYSKSVLRVAAEEVSADDSGIAYFPSYEIIVGNYNRGRYFGEDLREVTEEGVDHVMRLFLKYYGGVGSEQVSSVAPTSHEPTSFVNPDEAMIKATALICEEEALGR